MRARDTKKTLLPAKPGAGEATLVARVRSGAAPEPSLAQLLVTAQSLHTGYRFGSDHPQAKLTEHAVELMRTLHEEYPPSHPRHLGYRRLARIFGVSKSTVRRICAYRTWGRLA